MSNYAFISPDPCDNELAMLYRAAAPLSVETETSFAVDRYQHRTWRWQLHRAFMWAALWGDRPVLVNQTKLVGKLESTT